MTRMKDFVVGLFNTFLLPIISPFALVYFSVRTRKVSEMINCAWGLLSLVLSLLSIGYEKPAVMLVIQLIIGTAAYVIGFFESVSEFQSDAPFSDSERANIYFLGTLSLSSFVFFLL